jgi:hypothetical protein
VATEQGLCKKMGGIDPCIDLKCSKSKYPSFFSAQRASRYVGTDVTSIPTTTVNAATESASSPYFYS